MNLFLIAPVSLFSLSSKAMIVCFPAGEILENSKMLTREQHPKKVLQFLRIIGTEALSLAQTSHGDGFRKLKRVLRLFNHMSTSEYVKCRSVINVPDELFTFLEEWRSLTGSDGKDTSMLTLIDFMANESFPRDVLRALVLWSSSNDIGESLYHRLDALLRRGVRTSLKSELSGSLLRLKHARLNYAPENKLATFSGEEKEEVETTRGIWRRMAVGDLAIDK